MYDRTTQNAIDGDGWEREILERVRRIDPNIVSPKGPRWSQIHDASRGDFDHLDGRDFPRVDTKFSPDPDHPDTLAMPRRKWVQMAEDDIWIIPGSPAHRDGLLFEPAYYMNNLTVLKEDPSDRNHDMLQFDFWRHQGMSLTHSDTELAMIIRTRAG